MHSYYQKKNSRREMTVIPAKKLNTINRRQQTLNPESTHFRDTCIHYTTGLQGEALEPKWAANETALSAGTECLQAKWKPGTAFADRVSVNETARIRSHFERITGNDRIDAPQREIAAGLSRKLAEIDEPAPVLYIWERHELYVNGRLLPLSDEEILLLEDWIQQEQLAEEEPLTGDAPFPDDAPEPGDAPAPDEPALPYPRLDTDMDYLRQLNKNLDFLQGAAPDTEAPFDETDFFHRVEIKAIQLSREYLRNQYDDVCMQIERLKFYRRTKRPLYRELIQERSQSLAALKNLRKPLPFIFQEVLRQETDTARRMMGDEIARVWENVRYKNLFLSEGLKRANDKNDLTEQTRAGLITRGLMVLPRGLPLAGLFPDGDKVEIRDEEKTDKFQRLNEQAVRLITKYRLHYQDGGIIMHKPGCVCIMYFKERGEGKAFYKPAFGISGYFTGKGTAGVKTGFQAMGIPGYLLEAENKPDALAEYLRRCDLLGIRKPSIQARLSYLQKAREYRDIERWEPIICAEPAIVMAVHNLYGHAAELVLSFPFQGSLAQRPGHVSRVAGNEEPDTGTPDRDAVKEPIPKFTCRRCALAEKSFGAAVRTENGIERRQVRMSVKHNRFLELFNPDLIRNPDKNPFDSDGPAYMDLILKNGSETAVAKQTLFAFLTDSRKHGVFHGGKMDSPGTIPDFRQILPGEYIRDDHGNPVNYTDVSGIRHNCFFYALQAAVGIELDIGHIRETLRETLGNPLLFRENTMVGDNELNALRRLSSADFQRIFHTPGFTIQIYGSTGLLQSTDYGNVGEDTPVLINLGFNHFVVRQ